MVHGSPTFSVVALKLSTLKLYGIPNCRGTLLWSFPPGKAVRTEIMKGLENALLAKKGKILESIGNQADQEIRG